VRCQLDPPMATSRPPPLTQAVRASRWASTIVLVAMLSKIRPIERGEKLRARRQVGDFHMRHASTPQWRRQIHCRQESNEGPLRESTPQSSSPAATRVSWNVLLHDDVAVAVNQAGGDLLARRAKLGVEGDLLVRAPWQDGRRRVDDRRAGVGAARGSGVGRDELNLAVDIRAVVADVDLDGQPAADLPETVEACPGSTSARPSRTVGLKSAQPEPPSLGFVQPATNTPVNSTASSTLMRQIRVLILENEPTSTGAGSLQRAKPLYQRCLEVLAKSRGGLMRGRRRLDIVSGVLVPGAGRPQFRQEARRPSSQFPSLYVRTALPIRSTRRQVLQQERQPLSSGDGVARFTFCATRRVALDV